jgi:mRNA interferase MazF
MMMKPMQTYSPGNVVVVPFPFTDRAASKKRPALVCSSEDFNRKTRHLVLAMITTANHSSWADDISISDIEAAGLPAPSIVRWKLFTLDASHVVRRAGSLSARDRTACRKKQPVAI